MHADDEPRQILVRRKDPQAQCEQGQIPHKNQPAFPSARQAPCPTVSLRREPLAGRVGVGRAIWFRVGLVTWECLHVHTSLQTPVPAEDQVRLGAASSSPQSARAGPKYQNPGRRTPR